MKTSAKTFGQFQANFNEQTWLCDQISATISEVNGKHSLVLHIQNERMEYLIISILEFTGKGKYAVGQQLNGARIKIIFQGKRYFTKVEKDNGNLIITEYVPKSDKHSQSKISGTLEGILSDVSDNHLSITNGKFNSINIINQ